MLAEQFRERRQSARGDDIDVFGACLTKSAIRSAWTMAGAPVTRTASRRKAAFLPMLSTRWTCDARLSASAQAITKPGKPPPEPRSAQIRAFGARARSCSESAICRVQIVGSVEGAIKLVCRCHSRAARRSGRDGLLFHVKQASQGAIARRRSAAARSGCATCAAPSAAPRRACDAAGAHGQQGASVPLA